MSVEAALTEALQLSTGGLKLSSTGSNKQTIYNVAFQSIHKFGFGANESAIALAIAHSALKGETFLRLLHP